MAWRLVQQPNGLLARFSDTVDDFTHTNMAEDEAWAYLNHRYNHELALKKIAGAREDKVWGVKQQEDGLNRWRDSLNTIEVIHGPLRVAEAKDEIKNFPIPAPDPQPITQLELPPLPESFGPVHLLTEMRQKILAEAFMIPARCRCPECSSSVQSEIDLEEMDSA